MVTFWIERFYEDLLEIIATYGVQQTFNQLLLTNFGGKKNFSFIFGVINNFPINFEIKRFPS